MSQTLTEIWAEQQKSVTIAKAEGYLDDVEIQRSYLYPDDLDISPEEEIEYQSFVNGRMIELMERFSTDGGLDASFLASYLFRSILCGQMWERARMADEST